jgi:DNA invertase Pin-like site-specific DNA recombinase
MRHAYSYVRFSTPEQLKGDSLRRQTALSADYCKRNNLLLDDSLNLRDLGVSAFRGDNVETGALSGFLDAVKRGRVPKGAVLIVENLDRLTRDEIGKALSLFISILDAGVHIVTLRPEVEYTKQSINDIATIMQAVLQLFLGHEESAKKSGRLTEAWDAKRAEMKKRKLTSKCPFWLEINGDRTDFDTKPEAVEVVKRLFSLAAHGHGATAIARKMNEAGIPSPYGRAWNNVSVLWVLRNRAVIGEFTPHRGRYAARQAAGEPHPGYYPRIIDDAEFYAVQAAIAARKKQRGPRGKHVRNLFTGLAKDARDGTPMHVTEKRKGDVRMVSSGAMRGKVGAKYVSFPLVTFERAVLSMLAEVDPREVLGGEKGPDEVMALSGELARVESSIAAIEAELDANGESPTLFRRLRAREEEKRKLSERLSEAWQRAATPLSEAWGEARSLLEAVDAAPDQDDARLRLRAVFQRIISEVLVLIVPRGDDRIVAAQIWFADNKRSRDYVIYAEATKPDGRGGVTLGKWWARSLAGIVKPGTLDLRRRDDARKLEPVLASMPLDE